MHPEPFENASLYAALAFGVITLLIFAYMIYSFFRTTEREAPFSSRLIVALFAWLFGYMTLFSYNRYEVNAFVSAPGYQDSGNMSKYSFQRLFVKGSEACDEVKEQEISAYEYHSDEGVFCYWPHSDNNVAFMRSTDTETEFMYRPGLFNKTIILKGTFDEIMATNSEQLKSFTK